MMAQDTALQVAIDLLHVPSRVHRARNEPLPLNTEQVLLIAASDEAAIAAAAAATEREQDVLFNAARFFIEQILLAPGADSYRVLAARPDADPSVLRRHMALLLRGLHPDKDDEGTRSLFAARVTKAWEDVKTPERRAAYDHHRNGLEPAMAAGHRSAPAQGAGRRAGSEARHRLVRARRLKRIEKPGLLRRFVRFLFPKAGR